LRCWAVVVAATALRQSGRPQMRNGERPGLRSGWPWRGTGETRPLFQQGTVPSNSERWILSSWEKAASHCGHSCASRYQPSAACASTTPDPLSAASTICPSSHRTSSVQIASFGPTRAYRLPSGATPATHSQSSRSLSGQDAPSSSTDISSREPFLLQSSSLHRVIIVWLSSLYA